MLKWKWILIAAGASLMMYGCSAKNTAPPGSEAVQTEDGLTGEADAANAGASANKTAPANLAAAAKELIGLRNPSIGDASADGKLVDTVKQQLCVDQSSSLELMTDHEPYELILHFDSEPNQTDMKKAATVLLSLIDNCGIVSWDYPMNQGDGITTMSMDEKGASNFAGSADVKSYAQSEGKLQELLTLLSEIPGETMTGLESSTEAEQPALKAQEPDYNWGGG